MLAIFFLLGLACRSPVPANPATVSPEVIDALRVHGEAPVMIALVDPPGHTADARVDVPGRRAAIARLQAEVLARLAPGDYRSGHTFESVPAMSGTLLSERGLRVLVAHPNVRRVDLDVAGGGASPR